MKKFRPTFQQREGFHPLPSQMQPKILSPELRAKLWEVLYVSIDQVQYALEVADPWNSILYRAHVYLWHRMPNKYDSAYAYQTKFIGGLFEDQAYEVVLGFVEFVLRDEDCPKGLGKEVEEVLKETRAAYRVVDKDTIVPMASDEEIEAIEFAIGSAEKAEMEGARVHLRNAASEASAGRWADSIRESIHAVESAAIRLAPDTTTLAPALAALAKKVDVHTALQQGFAKIYGFTSDKSGIRHALLDKSVADVDEADALFMLGACASFVSYLIAKGGKAGLIK